MDTIYQIHSYLRWLVVVLLLLALIRLLITWLRKGEFTGADRGLLSAAVGSMDLQLLIGVILLIGWGVTRWRMEHGVTILLGIISAHMTARWKKLDGPTRARNSFFALLIAAILIYVGVMRLPGNGWTRWMNQGETTVMMAPPSR
jgi:hypothetical protein